VPDYLRKVTRKKRRGGLNVKLGRAKKHHRREEVREETVPPIE